MRLDGTLTGLEIPLRREEMTVTGIALVGRDLIVLSSFYPGELLRLEGLPDEPVIQPGFVRGDCNGDGNVRGVVTDAVVMLNFNFLGGVTPPCLAACDANGDGQFRGSVTDAVYLLNFNFLGGPPPAEPFPACGVSVDPGDLALGCAEPLTCP